MEKEITPRKTILFLTILLSVASYFALDHHYKTRAKDVIFTIVNSSGELIKMNNFMQFASNVKFVMSKEPFIKTVQLFDKDYRKLLNFGDEVDIATEYHKFNADKIQIIHMGPLEYGIKYMFENDSNLIMISFLHDDDRYLTLSISVLLIFMLFGFIYLVCQRLDIDNLNAKAAKHALDLMSCGFHEMKQTVELLRILNIQIAKDEVTFKNPRYREIFSKDFEKNMISVDSMMSILKLTNQQQLADLNEKTDIQKIIESCVEAYKVNSRNIDIQYGHVSELALSKDIVYATIGNLIKNAYNYSDGLIWIRTREENNRLIFSIANTGREIPKERQKAILKPGVALKGQTGLGLHICHTWCKRIGARLVLESNKAATQFSVSFPLPQRTKLKPATKKARAEIRVPQTKKAVRSEEAKLVAVIDDVETFRVSICEQIAEFSDLQEHFENMDLFLDQIKDQPKKFNYILVDRHGNGFDAVKDRFPDSCRYYGYQGKIILYSSDIPDMSEQEFRAKGFDHVVKKGNQIDWEYYLS